MSKKTLAQKIVDVMSEVTSVSKRGVNTFQNYKYAKESDYIEAIRPALIKHGVIVLPTLMSERMDPIKDSFITSIQMKFTVINADDPKDTYETIIPAQGSDKTDKGIYKAITGAKKYFVSNTFLIPTNDDAEDDSDEQRYSSKKELTPVAASTVTPSKFVASKSTSSKPQDTDSNGGW